ncbi:hypothetical protein QT970_03790 [Microcoleus sp. herbarium8]|uniref:hypothetical protein n=1 Tax=unclassified Microcoleus TaxID=2642155 RepID=UPI002FCFD8E8
MSYALQVGGELSDNYYDRLIDNYDGSDRPRSSFYLVEAKLAIAPASKSLRAIGLNPLIARLLNF